MNREQHFSKTETALLSMVTHTCNTSTEEAETSPRLHSEIVLCLNKTKTSGWRDGSAVKCLLFKNKDRVWIPSTHARS